MAFYIILGIGLNFCQCESKSYGVFTLRDTKTDVNTDSHWFLC